LEKENRYKILPIVSPRPILFVPPQFYDSQLQYFC